MILLVLGYILQSVSLVSAAAKWIIQFYSFTIVITSSILIQTTEILVFQQRYAHNPLSLYQTVQQCLSSEMHLVQRSEGVSVNCKHIKHGSFGVNINISAWSGCFKCHGQWHDLPDPAAAQCPQKVYSRMWNRDRENTTNARTPLNKFLQASSDIR